MTEGLRSRERRAEEVGEVTDEENAELWLAERKGGRIHAAAAVGE